MWPPLDDSFEIGPQLLRLHLRQKQVLVKRSEIFGLNLEQISTWSSLRDTLSRTLSSRVPIVGPTFMWLDLLSSLVISQAYPGWLTQCLIQLDVSKQSVIRISASESKLPTTVSHLPRNGVSHLPTHVHSWKQRRDRTNPSSAQPREVYCTGTPSHYKNVPGKKLRILKTTNMCGDRT